MLAAMLALLVGAPAAAANGPISMVKDINSTEGSDPTELTAVGNILYFSAFDDDHGRELWRSDGTADGTFMVADIKPGGGFSDPELMMGVGGILYFSAQDGSHGRELWRTDGTPSGTRMVKNISTGSTDFWKFAALGNQLFFDANAQLWVTNGTAQGTRAVGPVATDLAPFAGRMWFTSHDHLLWRSDGTAAGTKQVSWSPVAVNEIEATDDALFLLSGAPATLWTSDGTKAGTTELTGAGELDQANWLTAAGDRVFFYDTNLDPPDTFQLWRSNGTVAGTKALAVIPPDAMKPVAIGSRLYLFANAGGGSWELWKSNGTVAGTKTIDAFVALTGLDEMAALGDTLTFVIQDVDMDAWTLWQTDGSVGGSHAVTTQPVAWRQPYFMTPAGGRLFFSLDDGISGGELWSYLP
jgi:ELWxxDGT repeat protein